MSDKFKFHKTGLSLLKLLHRLDHSAIPVSACSSVLETLTFYTGLIFSAMLIDDLLAQAWKTALAHSGILVGLSLLFGLLQNRLSQIWAVKYQMLYTDLKILMRKKALSMTFESFEDPAVKRKIYLAERTIDMYGGLEEILYLYQQLFTSSISGIAAVGMAVHMCFAKGQTGQAGVIASVASFLAAVCLVMKATVLSSGRLLREQNQIYAEHGDAEEGLSYYMDQIYGNPEANKLSHLYQMKEMLLQNFKGFLGASSGLYKRMREAQKKQELAGQGISTAFTVYSYALVLWKIGNKAISIGSFSKYAGAMTQFMDDMTRIVWTNGEIARKCGFMQGLVDFLEMKDESRGGALRIQKGAKEKYEIQFHNVSFWYPGNENPTLHNVNCRITAGGKTAIVGKNGAGKTTFIKLLCGLYEPTEGKITLNGTDIREYDYQDYLNLFGVVFQDFAMFAFPVGQNIAVSGTYEEDRVWDCLARAGAGKAVEKMPGKLDTPMFSSNEDGINASGGEMQKLAIARALYKDASVMVLDEPTAALDPISEYEIYKHFDELVKNRTSIFITHRMSSCRFCDDILVFDSGKVAERGNHGELLQAQGLYAALWAAQANYYQEERGVN